MTASSVDLRVLVFSSLYPSAARPRHGIFVQTRLRQLLSLEGMDARVVAPVPWFPWKWSGFGDYSRWKATPLRERLHGIEVLHPRYMMLPKVGMAMQPRAMAAAGLRGIDELRAQGFEFDVIDAHYFYPDGVAASLISQRIGKPFVVTARGSDLNLTAQVRHARSRILEAASRAARVLCVSKALHDRALAIGIPADRMEVSRNGVDMALFTIRDRMESRRALGLTDLAGPLLLAVGNLVKEKGYELAIEALRYVPDATLLIIGDGPQRQQLERLAGQRGLYSRVLFMRTMPQDQLANAYSAADVLVLPSTREGWPNVLLEAMACGTPVVASDVGGVREIVCADVAGRILRGRSETAFGDAIRSILAHAPPREVVRRYADKFGWAPVAKQHRRILTEAANGARFHEPAKSNA